MFTGANGSISIAIENVGQLRGKCLRTVVKRIDIVDAPAGGLVAKAPERHFDAVLDAARKRNNPKSNANSTTLA